MSDLPPRTSMPDTPDAVRLVLLDALAEVYAGADLDDVDALLDQMTDRGLAVVRWESGAVAAFLADARRVRRAHLPTGGAEPNE